MGKTYNYGGFKKQIDRLKHERMKLLHKRKNHQKKLEEVEVEMRKIEMTINEYLKRNDSPKLFPQQLSRGES